MMVHMHVLADLELFNLISCDKSFILDFSKVFRDVMVAWKFWLENKVSKI